MRFISCAIYANWEKMTRSPVRKHSESRIAFIIIRSSSCFVRSCCTNFYALRLTWTEETASFVEYSQAEVKSALASCPPHQPCFSCGLRIQKMLDAEVRCLPDYGFAHRGLEYHLQDFVYIKDGPKNSKLTWKNASDF